MKISTILMCLPLVLGACGDDNSGTKQDAGTPPIDAPKTTIDAPTVAPPDASCFDLSTITSPTNNEIINACTTADKIYKDSHPPLLGSDGSLPPLP
jgi:hypothetical protein